LRSPLELCRRDHCRALPARRRHHRWAASTAIPGGTRAYQTIYAHAAALPGAGIVGSCERIGKAIRSKLTNALVGPGVALTRVAEVWHGSGPVGVPLLRDDVPIGVMTIARHEGNRSPPQIELVLHSPTRAVIARSRTSAYSTKCRAVPATFPFGGRSCRAGGRYNTKTTSAMRSTRPDLQTVLNTLVAGHALSGPEAGAILCVFDDSTRQFQLSRRPMEYAPT